jgi:nucleoid-associated protein YgaU
MAIAHVVVVPQGFAHRRPSSQVYARRRWALLVAATLIVLALALGAGTAMANRGGGPASAPAVRPSAAAAAAAAAAGAGGVYIVQPGDSLWALAGRLHGERSRSRELDLLIDANHGTKILVGQALHLP